MLRIGPLVPPLLVIQKGVLFGKIERLAPVDYFAIRIMSILSAERGPADETFEHDGSNRPPVTSERVALTAEDFWGYVIRSADGRVCKYTSIGFSPGISNAPTIIDRKVDLIEIYGVSILFLVRRSL